MNDRLLTTREVADLVGLSPETILRRWRAGELRGYRVSGTCLRFPPAAVDEWLAGCTLRSPASPEVGGPGPRRQFGAEGEDPDDRRMP
jgi:excisionase family DNA binding protein